MDKIDVKKQLEQERDSLRAQLAECQKERDKCCLCGEPILFAVEKAQLVEGFQMHGKCWKERLEEPRAQLSRLTAEVEKLRECEADTKRLNKVEFLRAKIECYAGSGVGIFVGQADYYGKTIRQAIDEIPDAAMSNPTAIAALAQTGEENL